jgi:hypothetical protein
MAYYLVSMEAPDRSGGTVITCVLVQADAPQTAVGIASPGGYPTRYTLTELTGYAPADPKVPGNRATFSYAKNLTS